MVGVPRSQACFRCLVRRKQVQIILAQIRIVSPNYKLSATLGSQSVGGVYRRFVWEGRSPLECE